MYVRVSFIIAVLSSLFMSCARKVDCGDPPIEPNFIGFSQADIDTLVVRKYKPNDAFQTLIDTAKIVFGYGGYYHISNDTTSVGISYAHQITAGNDWQVFIPAKNKTIFISDIQGDKQTTSCARFAMDHFDCMCANHVFSVKVDNQLVTFTNPGTSIYRIFIRN